MNIFFRELKVYRKSLLFWSLGMIALVASGMAKFAAYSNTGQSMNAILSQFPQSIQTIFGLTGFDLSKASGFISVLFMYIALMATIHAVLLGAGIISKEERDKTAEFLFVRPINRARVISSKIAAGIINLVVINIVTFISSVYFVNYFTKDNSTINYVITLMCGLFFLQLMFFFIGTAVAAINNKSRTSASIATSVLLFSFILTFLININNDLKNLKYLTPFKYFDAKDLLATGKLDVIYVSISLVVVFVMIFMTYMSFANKDLND